jgi:hypothetical protein
MSEVITYVGIDAHKRELHVALLLGSAATPVTWTVENEPKAIERLHRKLEREAPGPVWGVLLGGAVRLRAAAATDEGPGQLRRNCASADAAEAWGPGEDGTRDARKLAELFRAGLLTEVRPPTLAEEAVGVAICVGPAMTPGTMSSAPGIGSANCCCAVPALFGPQELDEGTSTVDPDDTVGASGGTRRRRRLPVGHRSGREPAHGTRCAACGNGPA